METQTVIFRRYRDSQDMLAVFPYDLSGPQLTGHLCRSYKHFEHWGLMRGDWILRDTHPVDPRDPRDAQDIKDLQTELEVKEGLTLVVVHRVDGRKLKKLIEARKENNRERFSTPSE